MYETTIEIHVRKMLTPPSNGLSERSRRIASAVQRDREQRAMFAQFDAQEAFQTELSELLRKYNMRSYGSYYIPAQTECDYERTIEKLATLMEMGGMLIPSITQDQAEQLAVIFEDFGYEIPLLEVLQNMW